jgi:hypothetical protein
MNSLFSKLTFGFVMAQLFPGAILLLSISVAFRGVFMNSVVLRVCIEDAINYWTANTSRVVFGSCLSVGLGMAIHGLNWSVIGFMEGQKSDGQEATIYKSFWHEKRVIIQILLGPIKMSMEILKFLWQGKELSKILLTENVNDVPKEKWDAFIFVQNFYLYFAQFYAHTSYALLFVLITLAEFTLLGHSKLDTLVLMAIVWIATGGSFIISRIQYGSLFTAEYELSGKLDENGKRKTGADV